MTESQQAILDFVHAHHEARNNAPTTGEVLRAFRFRYEAGVLRALESLAAAGHLTRVDDKWKLKAPQVQLHFGLTGESGLPPR